MNASDIIGGKYELISVLGQGGMGSVWRAQHLALNAPVAIKLIDPALASNPEGLARFHREAQAAAALRSPHVVQVLDHGVDEATRQPFIVMELMEGESLAGRIVRQGRLSPVETARIVAHIARALARAHSAGIVHRDLKPDNVFLVQNEDEEMAKVLDFGIAKSEAHRLGQGSATQTGAVMGTPYYMSPEQISGSKGVDFRTDLWALGVIACECLTGRRPFEAETIGGLALKICVEARAQPSSFGAVPAAFDQWFARVTAREPGQRFQSARELADSLRAVCTESAPRDGSTVFASASNPTLPAHFGHTETALSRSGDHVDPFRARSKALPIVVGVLGVAAVAGVAALWLRGAPAEGEASALPSASSMSPSAKPAAQVAPAPQERAASELAAQPAAQPPPTIDLAPAALAPAEVPALRPAPGSRPQLAKQRRGNAASEKPGSPAKSAAPVAASKSEAPPPSNGLGDVLDERR